MNYTGSDPVEIKAWEIYLGVASCCGYLPEISDDYDYCGVTDRRILCEHCLAEVGWCHRTSANRSWNRRHNREDLIR